MKLVEIARELRREVDSLQFTPPVTHVYNPLEYARRPHDIYLRRYGRRPKEILLLGMNPGPWGMAQTGVPFGEVAAVREWLGIDATVDRPPNEHPKRPVEGLQCGRSEVSGQRLWGWARERFFTPDSFFQRFFVYNYCPLLFLEESGRNRTPDKLPKTEQQPLLEACDRALRRCVDYLRPRYVVGVGAFAESRAARLFSQDEIRVARILHPSPASPLANRNWAQRASQELEELGIRVG